MCLQGLCCSFEGFKLNLAHVWLCICQKVNVASVAALSTFKPLMWRCSRPAAVSAWCLWWRDQNETSFKKIWHAVHSRQTQGTRAPAKTDHTPSYDAELCEMLCKLLCGHIVMGKTELLSLINMLFALDVTSVQCCSVKWRWRSISVLVFIFI